MKNIFLGSIFMLVFLPQASFAAACNQQLDADAVAFFQQQAQERGVFIKANAVLIAKQDQLGKWLMVYKNDAQNGITSSEPSPPPLTSEEENIFAAFKQKQLNDKQAFFQQQVQARQNCLNS